MPTYEYACKQCGHHLEVVQSFSAAPLTECPNCQGPLRKVFSAPGIAFKGSGFYKNDSRSSSSSSSSSSSASSETKSDTPKADAPKPDAPAKADSASSSPKAD